LTKIIQVIQEQDRKLKQFIKHNIQCDCDIWMVTVYTWDAI